MPRGSVHTVVGILRRSASGLELDVDGGCWRLEAPWRRTAHLLGRRVRVVGIRDEFNLLAVQTMELT